MYWCYGNCIRSEITYETYHNQRLYAHRDVEIHAAFVSVVADKHRLHPNVGNINGARKEEEDGQTRK